MKLQIATPTQVVVDREVRSVHAEDASGSFGVLGGHADLLTVLDISIVSWRDPDDRPGYCAITGGILSVTKGRQVSITTREAHAGEDLEALEGTVLAAFHRHTENELEARTGDARSRMLAIRHMVQALQDSTGKISL